VNDALDSIIVPASRTLPTDRAQHIKRALRQERSRRPTRRWHVSVPVAVAAAGVGLAATGAGFYIQSSTASDTSLVRCYSQPSRDFGKGFPGTSVALDVTGASSPTQQCALVWRDGILRPGQPRPQDPDTSRTAPVPALQACVLPNGMAAVFPGDDGVCEKLSRPTYIPPQ